MLIQFLRLGKLGELGDSDFDSTAKARINGRNDEYCNSANEETVGDMGGYSFTG